MNAMCVNFTTINRKSVHRSRPGRIPLTRTHLPVTPSLSNPKQQTSSGNCCRFPAKPKEPASLPNVGFGYGGGGRDHNKAGAGHISKRKDHFTRCAVKVVCLTFLKHLLRALQCPRQVRLYRSGLNRKHGAKPNGN